MDYVNLFFLRNLKTLIFINVYLNIIEEFKSEIHESLFSAADSVMPIFIEQESDIDFAFEECSNLKFQLELPPSLQFIGEAAFAE